MDVVLALIVVALLAWGALGVFVPKFTFNSRAVAIFIASIISVSYTHLDVYKRQA